MNFSDTLLRWYRSNNRGLPWRDTKDPYKIWISEIILQQTRVDQGIPYYSNFIRQFPNIQVLSEASEQSILNVWKGLGYYSRARNIHYTAKYVVQQLNGKFPCTYKSLMDLKGVGAYTAAAIASICFNESVPAIDGNVTRVISRYYGIEDAVSTSIFKRKIKLISEQLIPLNTPGDYNQAVMEYGAVICKPMAPKCEICTLYDSCFAFQNNKITILPKKKKQIKKKMRFFNYIHLVLPNNMIVIKQRLKDDIWKYLWELPLVECDKLLDYNELKEISFFNYLHQETVVFKGSKDIIHQLSHQTLNIRIFTLNLSISDLFSEKEYTFANQDDNSYPFPRIIENFLKTH